MPGKRRVRRNVCIRNVQMSSQQFTDVGQVDPRNVNEKQQRFAPRRRDSVVENSRDGRSDLRRRPGKQRPEGVGSESTTTRRRPLVSRQTVKRREVRKPQSLKTREDPIAVTVSEVKEWKDDGDDDEMGFLGAIPTEPTRRGKSATKVNTAGKEKKGGNYLK